MSDVRPASAPAVPGRRPRRPITRAMAGGGIDPALRHSVERGEYVVDARAVADAMLRSGVLVPTQVRDRSVRSEQDQSGPG